MGFTYGTYITQDNGVVDFAKMKQSYPFVFIRVTHGDANDKNFQTNYGAAQSAGLLRGAVHEHDFHTAAPAQLTRFLTRIMGDRGNIPPLFMLTDKGCLGINPTAIMKRLDECFSVLEDSLGIRPKVMIGFSENILEKYIRWFPDNLIKGRELFSVALGQPNPFKWQQFTRWLFWEYTEMGSGLMAGTTSKYVPMVKFNGDVTVLRRFCGILTDENSGEINNPPVVGNDVLARLEALEKRVSILENK